MATKATTSSSEKSEPDLIENVLATRYATPDMKSIWSARGKIAAERRLWVAVMRAQRRAGMHIPERVIKRYEAEIDDIDLVWIETREREIRHDVKARIEAFNRAAGVSPEEESIHLGMTSRDLTDNVEMMQIRQALMLVRLRIVTILGLISVMAQQYEDQPMAGRSHNVVGQVTTLGKRLATIGVELLQGFTRIDELIARYPLRGIKGAMGTGQDMIDLLGNPEKLGVLEQEIMSVLGFATTLTSTGQVYPRSLDFDVVSALALAAAAPSNLALNIRLWTGFELASEGFKAGQVGSSAMPHKMNSRSSERINGLNIVLHGYVGMIGGLSGNQWQEGDVSCSVVRRVALPDAFFAFDGLVETTLTVLGEMGFYPAMIERELNSNLPFLTTTKVLMAMVKAGVGREQAHEVIKEHTVALARERRTEGIETNERVLFARLAADDRVPLRLEQLQDLVGDPHELIGDSVGQVSDFQAQARVVLERFPEAAGYRPSSIL